MVRRHHQPPWPQRQGAQCDSSRDLRTRSRGTPRAGLITGSDSTSRTSHAGLSIFATVGYLAALIALWGILSVIVDRDVVDYADAGPLLGPAMATAACVVTFTWVMRAGAARSPWVDVVGAAVVTYLATLLVAAVGYSITRGDFSWMPAAAVHFALGPFVPTAAVLSSVVVAGSNALARRPGQRSS